MGRRDAGEGRLDGYAAADRARQVVEPPKRSARGDFARDRARVLHSSGLRRLGAKTQVVTPGDDDFARTRLTHSLEVAQVGRGLADALGCDPDVVDTACLAHDLGHPPFGHNGETVLAEAAAGVGGFEGNAQTLRLLSRLEPKVVDADGRAAGLNLTRASLDAATKYPWAAGEDPRGATGKFGVYRHDLSDATVFAWLREGAPPARRCLEAQVMDLADDVAYSVHDVEDAVVAHRLDLGDLADPGHRARVAAAVTAHLPDAAEDEVAGALDALAASTGWVTGFDGSRAALAGLKDLTSQLIGRFCGAVEGATREAVGPGRLTRYAADLVVPRATAVEITVLKAVASVFVMTADDRMPVYERQRQVLGELVASLVEHPERLEPPFAADHAEAADDGARLRVVVDQVASLTDASALTWWARSTGAVGAH